MGPKHQSFDKKGQRKNGTTQKGCKRERERIVLFSSDGTHTLKHWQSQTSMHALKFTTPYKVDS